MHGKFWMAILGAAALAAFAGCSSDSGGSSTSGSSGGSSTAGSTGSTGGSSSGSTSGSSGGSSGGAVNGCTAASATDMTGQAAVTVAISGFAYSPPCVKVDTGTVVTIDASTVHPLRPGTDCHEDTTGQSPITSSTSNEAVTFGSAGTFGFFCANHCVSNGMKGAVFVQ